VRARDRSDRRRGARVAERPETVAGTDGRPTRGRCRRRCGGALEHARDVVARERRPRADGRLTVAFGSISTRAGSNVVMNVSTWL
jgi:hypothetical protein